MATSGVGYVIATSPVSVGELLGPSGKEEAGEAEVYESDVATAGADASLRQAQRALRMFAREPGDGLAGGEGVRAWEVENQSGGQ